MTKFLHRHAPGAVELNKTCPACNNKYVFRIEFKKSWVYRHPFGNICRVDKR